MATKTIQHPAYGEGEVMDIYELDGISIAVTRFTDPPGMIKRSKKATVIPVIQFSLDSQGKPIITYG